VAALRDKSVAEVLGLATGSGARATEAVGTTAAETEPAATGSANGS
jgi:hypothetical protein